MASWQARAGERDRWSQLRALTSPKARGQSPLRSIEKRSLRRVKSCQTSASPCTTRRLKGIKPGFAGRLMERTRRPASQSRKRGFRFIGSLTGGLWRRGGRYFPCSQKQRGVTEIKSPTISACLFLIMARGHLISTPDAGRNSSDLPATPDRDRHVLGQSGAPGPRYPRRRSRSRRPGSAA